MGIGCLDKRKLYGTKGAREVRKMGKTALGRNGQSVQKYSGALRINYKNVINGCIWRNREPLVGLRGWK